MLEFNINKSLLESFWDISLIAVNKQGRSQDNGQSSWLHHKRRVLIFQHDTFRVNYNEKRWIICKSYLKELQQQEKKITSNIKMQVLYGWPQNLLVTTSCCTEASGKTFNILLNYYQFDTTTFGFTRYAAFIYVADTMCCVSAVLI